jgi:hypothetical protein
MKQYFILDNDTPQNVRLFIEVWQRKKGYTISPVLSYGHLVELQMAVSNNLHYEESDPRFFNNILINNESVIGWEGQEPIDIVAYEVIQNIKRLIVVHANQKAME